MFQPWSRNPMRGRKMFQPWSRNPMRGRKMFQPGCWIHASAVPHSGVTVWWSARLIWVRSLCETVITFAGARSVSSETDGTIARQKHLFLMPFLRAKVSRVSCKRAEDPALVFTVSSRRAASSFGAKKFALHAGKAPNWAISSEQGEFCTGSGAVWLVQGEFCTGYAVRGCDW